MNRSGEWPPRSNIDTLAVYLGMLGTDFQATEPPELVDHVRALAARYARAVTP